MTISIDELTNTQKGIPLAGAVARWNFAQATGFIEVGS